MPIDDLPIILYRKADMEPDELEAAERYFPVTSQRTTIPQHALVIGRYSVLPFYRELERDVLNLGGRLINSARQHEWIADLRNWTEDLADLTPQTWYRMSDVPRNAGPFVLKGMTNSRKDRWRTHMYAESWEEMTQVHYRLSDDALISSQGIAIRKYVPLKTYMTGLNGQPITQEFRVFAAYGQHLTTAYYWSSHIDELKERGIRIVNPPVSFITSVIKRIGDKANFYAVDVAQTEAGGWIVIEVNDGQMSGLSETDPDELYRALRTVCGGLL